MSIGGSHRINDYYIEIEFWDANYHVPLMINTRAAIFEHYYNEDAAWGSQYGTLIEKTEVGEIETACGNAVVYYVKSEKDGKEYEEEVAFINNRETNIVIKYCDYAEYDGICDNNLEKFFQ